MRLKGYAMDNQLMCGAINCGAITLFQEATDYRGPERRDHRRYPRTLGISVEPIDPRENTLAPPFPALTREVSRSGLSFLSSKRADAEMVGIKLQDDRTRVVVCRVCNCECVSNEFGTGGTYLTSVEFLYERQLA